jgi:hypothetical protein
MMTDKRRAPGQRRPPERLHMDHHPALIRILHLSDLHLRADTAWDAHPVLARLTGFLKEEVAAGLVPRRVGTRPDALNR